MKAQCPVPPIKMKIPPILAKKSQKIVTKPSSQCAIPHENQSQPQISRNRLQPTQQSQIFEPSVEGTTPNQGPLPQPMNTPTTDTDEHYTRPLKTLYIILRSVLTNRHMHCILQIGSFNRGLQNYTDLVLCTIRSHQKDIKLYMLDPFHQQRQGQQAFENIYKPSYLRHDPLISFRALGNLSHCHE